MPIIDRDRPHGNARTNTHYRYGPPTTSYRDVRARGDEIEFLILDYKLVVRARDRKPVGNTDRLRPCSLVGATERD